jgi:hypothetical protein
MSIWARPIRREVEGRSRQGIGLSLPPAARAEDDQDCGGTMKYMLIHCVDESLELSADEVTAVEASLASWIEDTVARGVNLHGSRLQPTSDATTVRMRNDEVLIADGPFAETKEQIGGYDVIECANLDEAIAVAAEHPTARIGTIEVRPFWAD